MAINFSKIVEIRSMSVENLFGDQEITNTSDLICKSIIMLNEEFSKRGHGDNSWMDAPLGSLRGALDCAVHREDWKAMITFSLMLAGVDDNPAAHIKRVWAEHMLYASQKDNTIKSLNTAIDGHKKVCVELRNQNDAMQARINALVKEGEELQYQIAGQGRDSVRDAETIKRLNGEIDELAGQVGTLSVSLQEARNEVSRVNELFASEVAEHQQTKYRSVAENTQLFINTQRDEIKLLKKQLAAESAAHEHTKLNGGEGTMAGYRLSAQSEEISRLNKLLTAKGKEVANLKEQLTSFDREDEKSEGSVGTCSTVGVGSTPAFSCSRVGDVASYKLTFPDYEFFDNMLGRIFPDVPTHVLYGRPVSGPNCRCVVTPVPEPKSSLKIKIIVNRPTKGADLNYEFNGTVEEIKKAMAELELPWN